MDERVESLAAAEPTEPRPAVYLIWSNERGGWWKPARRGYTQNVAEAGRYDPDAAAAIVADWVGGPSPYGPGVAHEVAVLAPELSWHGE